MKKIFLSILSIVMVFGISGCGVQTSDVSEHITSKPDSGLGAVQVTGDLYIKALDVGKGDSFILKTQNSTVVIDTGYSGDHKKIISELENIGVQKIDCLILTHFDKDHIGGAAKLIKKFPIDRILVPNYETDSSAYSKYLSALEAANKKEQIVDNNLSFVLDDVVFNIYPPKEKVYRDNDNDFSLVISIIHGENTFLFCGDAEDERISEMENQISPMQHKLLKLPHHGRLDGKTNWLIENVKPEYALITCSDDEPADPVVLSILDEMGCRVNQTSDGDIAIKSDGKTLNIQQQGAEK